LQARKTRIPKVFPVLSKASSTVAHGMTVLAQDDRSLLRVVLGLVLAPLGALVHGANDVGCPGARAARLVLYTIKCHTIEIIKTNMTTVAR
jgi:hypothetical protein